MLGNAIFVCLKELSMTMCPPGMTQITLPIAYTFLEEAAGNPLLFFSFSFVIDVKVTNIKAEKLGKNVNYLSVPYQS